MIRPGFPKEIRAFLRAMAQRSMAIDLGSSPF
jgi:hypothetical protein